MAAWPTGGFIADTGILDDTRLFGNILGYEWSGTYHNAFISVWPRFGEGGGGLLTHPGMTGGMNG